MEQQLDNQQALIANISELITNNKYDESKKKLNELHPAEIAHLLESLPNEERRIAWEQTKLEFRGDTLTYLNDDVRSDLIDETTPDELIAATGSLATDALADILPDLPEKVIAALLHAMDIQDKLRLESILKYPEDTAGGLMSIDSVTVRPDVALDVVLRYLRFRGELPDTTDYLFVVNREDRLLGALSLSDILTKPTELSVMEVYDPEIRFINADTNAQEIASLFEKRDLVSAPVVDENHKLLGRITIDDVVDIIREEADHSILSLAGLEDGNIFSPIIRSTRRRSVWLGVNLLTALLASWVISLFSATIEQLVALAVLMPIVASMGGIAGSQTLTLVIRGIAVGQVGKANARKLLYKEFAIGVLNGLLWAIIIGVLAYFWFNNIQLGIILGVAIFFNLIVAAVAGATIPLMLQRVGADPALAGSVVLTTVTDVVGFFAFLGLAATFLI